MIVRAVIASYMRAPALFAVVLLAMGYQIGFNLFLPLMTRHVFDDVLPRSASGELKTVAALLAGALFGRVLAALTQERSMGRLAARAMAERRSAMFDTLQRKPGAYFNKTPAADVLSRFSSDLAVVENATSRLVPRVIYNALNIAACTVLMATLDLRLAGAAVVALLFAFLGPRRLGGKAAALNTKRREAEGSLLGTVQESVALHNVVRTFAVERWVRSKYDRDLGRFQDQAGRATFAGSMVEAFTVLAFSAVQVLVLCIGAWLVIRGNLSPGQLIAFTALVGTISSSTFGLSAMIPPLIESASGHARIEELLADDPKSQGVEIAPLKDAISFDHVTFSYTGERKDLQDVSFDIRAGTSAAFVGPSGSGKSTALSLITRSNTPQAGHVRLDGNDLANASTSSLYNQMAIVAQESLLFDATVRENIRVGRLDATDAEIEEAAKRAEIHETILKLARGYDTPVGERGGKLSGGQRQRIAIARAILRNPRLLVLDEATSALDPTTEEAVAKTLADLSKGRTTVSVTHRLSTITDYDCIFVMKDGQLVESGSHAALLERAGLYRQLWDKQMGVAVTSAGEATLTPAWLATVPLFASLDEATRIDLAKRFVTLKINEGHELFRAGDPGDSFYVVARGKMAIDAGTRTNLLVDGDCFGEIALLEEGPRTASARAQTDCTLLSLGRPQFQTLLAQAPAIASALRQKADAHLAADRKHS